jgi:hypothetical protein
MILILNRFFLVRRVIPNKQPIERPHWLVRRTNAAAAPLRRDLRNKGPAMAQNHEFT